MARSSVREELRQRMRDHLAVAELHPPEEASLDVRNVASVLRVSPTTLYKYGFNREINAAEQRQRENSLIAGAIIEQQCFKNQIQQMREELDCERERSRSLVARIAIMEANAARLGFDPEEMRKPLVKPIRTTSRAGTNKSRSGGTRPF
jgi:hypothetical protein